MKAFTMKGSAFVDALKAKGILPDNCSRVIIDVGIDRVAKVYYECLGDSTHLDAELAETLLARLPDGNNSTINRQQETGKA